MFNLQGGEIIIILLLALVVLGPEKLPEAMRRAGKFYAEIKKMSAGFQSEFRAAVDEPLRELRETAQTIKDSADFTKLQTGERDEKPKSAEMGAVSADARAAPAAAAEPPAAEPPAAEPAAAPPAPSEQAPFSSVIVSGGAARPGAPAADDAAVAPADTPGGAPSDANAEPSPGEGARDVASGSPEGSSEPAAPAAFADVVFANPTPQRRHSTTATPADDQPEAVSAGPGEPAPADDDPAGVEPVEAPLDADRAEEREQ